MRVKIRNWAENFERDRTKQWKNLQWVPIPNKQGTGYRKIMSESNGPEIFGCWIALVEIASTSKPRGDLSKYDINSLSLLSMIRQDILSKAIKYLSEVIDWIEVIENLDINVNNLDVDGQRHCDSSSILFSSILSSSIEGGCKGETKPQKKPKPQIPEHLKEIWPDFVEMRKKARKPLTDRAIKGILNDLEKLSNDKDTQVVIVEESIKNCWAGVFPLKNNAGGTNGRYDHRAAKAAREFPEPDLDF